MSLDLEELDLLELYDAFEQNRVPEHAPRPGFGLNMGAEPERVAMWDAWGALASHQVSHGPAVIGGGLRLWAEEARKRREAFRKAYLALVRAILKANHARLCWVLTGRAALARVHRFEQLGIMPESERSEQSPREMRQGGGIMKIESRTGSAGDEKGKVAMSKSVKERLATAQEHLDRANGEFHVLRLEAVQDHLEHAIGEIRVLREGLARLGLEGGSPEGSLKEQGSQVDHPRHYNEHPSGVECIDVVEGLTFNMGNAIKYLWRAGLKESEPPGKDFDKAVWYVRREVALIKETGVVLLFALASRGDWVLAWQKRKSFEASQRVREYYRGVAGGPWTALHAALIVAAGLELSNLIKSYPTVDEACRVNENAYILRDMSRYLEGLEDWLVKYTPAKVPG